MWLPSRIFEKKLIYAKTMPKLGHLTVLFASVLKTVKYSVLNFDTSSLKGHSHEKKCEIIALNYSLNQN
jgi:hypothetical protein